VAGRYRGQSHELTVPAAGWEERFHAAHEQRFGYARRGSPLEAVTLGVEATAPAPAVPEPVVATAAGPAPAAGQVRTWHEGRLITAARYARDALRAGHEVTGPALLLESTSAFWLPPGWTARVAQDGSLFVER
jgi:N-methylhydantoinase A/oxoprolinase/acetone carboxylase beta subunit